MLARAALANVSPVLLADAKDWNNLYFALGHTPKVARFRAKSADITSVLSRLQDALPSFNKDLADFCTIQVGRRNEELHSGTTPFDGVQPDGWMPSFYDAAQVLLESIGETLEALLGTEESQSAIQVIAAAKDVSAKAVGKTIEAHKKIWTERSKIERQKLATRASAWAARHLGHVVACPACNSDSLLTGSPLTAPVKQLSEGDVVETQVFLPNSFECIACGLRIGTLAQLQAAGLGASFKATQIFSAADYFGPDDPFDGYEPDFNEP